MTRAVRTLLTDLVDYARLFPPAKLAMQPAVEEYNRCRVGKHEFMLGRFICPASRLEEFSAAAAPFMPGTFATSGYQEQADAGPPWLLSVLLDADSLHDGLDAIDAFNARHSAAANGQALADAVEIRVSDVNQIDSVLDELPEDLYPYFEFPVAADCRGFVAALAGNKAAAKIRTGGVTAPAFPTAAEIAGFLVACAKADVPFKATAGLHHPLRSAHALTHEPGSTTCTMHGFLNVFIAAALVKCKGLDVERVEALLLEEDPAAFKFGDEFVSWQAHGLERLELAKAREAFALSFGSCSFDEPVADLTRLGWL